MTVFGEPSVLDRAVRTRTVCTDDRSRAPGPPIVAVGIKPRRHAYRNIRRTGSFVDLLPRSDLPHVVSCPIAMARTLVENVRQRSTKNPEKRKAKMREYRSLGVDVVGQLEHSPAGVPG